MNTKVFAIFDKTYFKDGIQRYFDVGREIGLVPLHGDILNGDALVALNRLYMMEHVYRKDVLQVIDLFHKSVITEKRISQLYALLGEMVCYWFIREYAVVRKLQEDVKVLQYGSTWWERNKKDVASVAGAILAGAMALAGGGAAPVGGIATKGGQAVGECVDDHQKLEYDFNRLKEAIVAINFNVKS